MTPLDEVISFVENRVRKQRPDFTESIEADTSVIRSGLLDSLGLLDLAVWIERRLGARIELQEIDPVADWDTPRSVVRFLETRSGSSGG